MTQTKHHDETKQKIRIIIVEKFMAKKTSWVFGCDFSLLFTFSVVEQKPIFFSNII